MARIEFAPGITGDFDRILEHLGEYGVADAGSRIRDMITAIGVLERNPLIGRPTSGPNRELVIGRGSRAYIALYRYVEDLDIAFILAIRSQREAGYSQRDQ